MERKSFIPAPGRAESRFVPAANSFVRMRNRSGITQTFRGAMRRSLLDMLSSWGAIAFFVELLSEGGKPESHPPNYESRFIDDRIAEFARAFDQKGFCTSLERVAAAGCAIMNQGAAHREPHYGDAFEDGGIEY
jgi:hypothetical protein